MIRPCFFYLKASDTPPNQEDIKKALVEGTIEQKIKMMKQFIKCLVNDDTFPPLIMVIITNIIPLLSKHPQLRKVLLLYWEVIDKAKSPNDPTLKDQMFLACNSLRSQLLCHNEYLRGRTLRLISRIMHKGVIEPLASAITDNIKHKSAYVRRNTVVCLYNIFVNFKGSIIGQIDEEIQELLKTETDVSTKRNAFILLNKSNPEKAMQYLEQQIKSQALEDIGDILQLAILKVLKQKARETPQNRAKFLKTINAFTYRASESVLLECSITSLAISNSVLSIKTALSSYVTIFSRTNQLNVKKIILDKLEIACKTSNYIEESLVEDLVKNLNTPSYEIKIKILNIVSMNLNPKNSSSLLVEMKKQISECTDKDYQYKIIKTIQIMAFKFELLHKQILQFILTKVFKLTNLATAFAECVGNILRLILQKSQKNLIHENSKQIINNFKHIQSKQTIKQILNIFGSVLTSQQDIQLAIDSIRSSIGALPITIQTQNKTGEKQANIRPKVSFKTKIQEDGSYLTQIVQQTEEDQNQVGQETFFRKIIAEDSIVGGVFARNVAKLLYKIRKSPLFSTNACSIVMILCSLLRNYQQHIYQVDQATVDQISGLIRKVINPEEFINSVDQRFQTNLQKAELSVNKDEETDAHVLEKNPSDLVFFRQLKKGTEEQQQFDDEQVNQILNQKKQKQSFVQKLKSMVQLTGHFDAVYAEAFITVSKTDLFFQILMINTTKMPMSNVQIQFASTTQILILQKAQSVNLRPLESANLRVQLRFVTGQFGSIYGYINYDNSAGIEQPYLITQEIKIDFMQFILPAKIGQREFKFKWLQYENHERKHEKSINTSKSSDEKVQIKAEETKEKEEQKKEQKQKQKVEEKPKQYKKIVYEKIFKYIEQQLHCLRVSDEYDQKQRQQEYQEYFLSKSFYGKSKMKQDFLIIITFFRAEDIEINFTIRSKEAAISNMLMQKISDLHLQKANEEPKEYNRKE